MLTYHSSDVRFVSLIAAKTKKYLSVGQNSMEEMGEPRWTFLLQWATSIVFTSTTQKSPSRFPLNKGENYINNNDTSQPKENQAFVVKHW